MRCVVILHKPPEFSESTSEAIELAMSMANFGVGCAVWVTGDALQWVNGELPRHQLGRFDNTKLLKALPFYEIDEIWALADERPEAPLDEVAIQWLTRDELAARLASAELVIGE
ncbi:MAG: hypothetical protein D6694_13115 [Gammaproteobacteria bacterium]|nr:MAG: hypothetical protein D6694_13115 [Gammaproteobacteria bacterium]